MRLWRRFWDWLVWGRLADVPQSCHCWEVHDLGDGWVVEQRVSQVEHHHRFCPMREQE